MEEVEAVTVRVDTLAERVMMIVEILVTVTALAVLVTVEADWVLVKVDADCVLVTVLPHSEDLLHPVGQNAVPMEQPAGLLGLHVAAVASIGRAARIAATARVTYGYKYASITLRVQGLAWYCMSSGCSAARLWHITEQMWICSP